MGEQGEKVWGKTYPARFSVDVDDELAVEDGV